MSFEELSADYQARKAAALAMGNPKTLEARRSNGVLNARERIALLADPGSFLETGLFAVSQRPEVRQRTPADGKVTGFAKVAGRPVALISNDFSVMGAASSRINGKKMRHAKHLSRTAGMPAIFFGESTGARMPDVMGAGNIGAGEDPTQYMRVRETPWVSAVLGDCYGSSAWYAALSDFVVMRRGSVMAVSSAKLAEMATGERIDREELGGWRVHAEDNGLVDLAVDTDEEAIAAVKEFLSYLPSNHNECPPTVSFVDGADEAVDDVLKYFPENRNRAYDVKKVLKCIFDRSSLFELKQRFGRSVVTSLARLGGETVGVIANNPFHKGGAIDADACDKVTSFFVLCDSFNIPVVLFVDQPGFLVGKEGERKGVIGKVMNWMNAMSLVTMPKISIVMGKSYGQAVLNMGGASNAHQVAAWTTAEIGFMTPEFGVRIVHGTNPEIEPERYKIQLAEMARSTSPFDAAANFSIQAVIEPRETRDYLLQALDYHRLRLDRGIGQHLMQSWPTSY